MFPVEYEMKITVLFTSVLSAGRLHDRVNEGICEGGNVERMDNVRSRSINT